MNQSTTPSLSQTIWLRWASRQFHALPIVETLLPVTFAYSLSSEAVVMIQLRRWKKLWRSSLTSSHKRTSVGLPEVVETVQQMHCIRRKLLRSGLEFHVCTINKSAHTKKVWKMIVCPIYLSVYLCVYAWVACTYMWLSLRIIIDRHLSSSVCTIELTFIRCNIKKST